MPARPTSGAPGVPAAVADLSAHALVGPPASPAVEAFLRGLGLTGASVGLQASSPATRLHAILAGAGIGGLLPEEAAGHPGLVPVLPELALPPLPLWLVIHRDQRAAPAIRVVRAAIRDALREADAHERPEPGLRPDPDRHHG